VFLWTAPAALDSPCRLGGEATFQREIASRRQLLGRLPGSSGASAHCCPQTNFGSSVERTAKLHPLWQGLLWQRERRALQAALWSRCGVGTGWRVGRSWPQALCLLECWRASVTCRCSPVVFGNVDAYAGVETALDRLLGTNDHGLGRQDGHPPAGSS